ncbi:hypothetical protein [Hyphomicrobium sp. DY-1]|uniref:hypothetical protein n=1 Tax=Hyphomicrobium sp. DY-1 TaxID=3075650 RepID=UPI0039C1CA58
MRTLEGHKVNPVNDLLLVEVLDEPGHGGACHEYQITTPPPASPAYLSRAWRISFQNGPIAEHGVNGVTHEALLSILIDRLECFQGGPFANAYNAAALDHLRGAQSALQARTLERMARGVEGTHQK